jgi:small subunit ribosomal protein S6
MNNYEGIFILKPDIKEEDLKTAYKAIGELVTKNGGNVKKEDVWGKRPLSYPINKCKEAHYYKLDFEAPSEAIAKLEGSCKMATEILRIMITRR